MAPLCPGRTGVTHWKSLQPGLLATRWVGWKIRTGPPSDSWFSWIGGAPEKKRVGPSESPGDFQVKSKVLELQFSSQLIPLALHLGAKRNPALKASTAAEKVDVIHAGDCHKLS
jgi:hypothetical protein